IEPIVGCRIHTNLLSLWLSASIRVENGFGVEGGAAAGRCGGRWRGERNRRTIDTFDGGARNDPGPRQRRAKDQCRRRRADDLDRYITLLKGLGAKGSVNGWRRVGDLGDEVEERVVGGCGAVGGAIAVDVVTLRVGVEVGAPGELHATGGGKIGYELH